jgi:hypothetical protein
LARFKVLADVGMSPNAIGQQSGRDPKTVRKWLGSDVYQNDEDLAGLVDLLKKKELDDLYVLGAKGRQRLHELIDSGKTRMIETIALVDRTFQQRRLLEGGTTANVGVLGRLLIEAERELGQDPKRDCEILKEAEPSVNGRIGIA